MRWSLAAFAALQVVSAGKPLTEREIYELRNRAIVTDGVIGEEYDFVIVGAGAAGLTIAARLAEDANSTVLVLEAGKSGDEVKSSIDVPGNAYYTSLLNTDYDWQYKTVPQTHAGNRVLPWPRGKVIGGSTAVNGMYYVRPSTLEIDTWGELIKPEDPKLSSAWSWNSLFDMMKKSETFSPPSSEIQSAGAILYDENSHGSQGPLHSSYPGYLPPVVGDWTKTLEWIGILTSPDANSGAGWGGFIATSFINPSNWTRSYARHYIDHLPPRSNLQVLPDAMATRIVWDTASPADSKRATAVEFAATQAAPKRTVRARREVILAGGAIGSPQLLMVSGVGPKDVLDAAGVDVVVELPGVGQHLQDHIATEVVWKTSAQTAASIRNQGTGESPDFLSFINSAIAYVNITDLFGDYDTTFQKNVLGELDASAQSLVPSIYPEVVEGYKDVYRVGVEKFMLTKVGQVELLLSLTGTGVGGADSIAIQAALQHPFSHGRLYISSPDVFVDPVIDPNYLSHSADGFMLREGLKLARKLGATEPLKSKVLEEVSPGANITSDADWDQWLTEHIQTEYHPSCTCSMLPRKKGGVVDANLRVYGTSNVRVADSSVYPIQFAAHLAAPTFGLAEQAAEIIRAQYNGKPSPADIANENADKTSSAAPGSTGRPGGNNGNSNSNDDNSASMLKSGFALVGAAVLGALAVAGL